MSKQMQTETSAAFKDALNQQLTDQKKWNGVKSLTVARATLNAIKKSDGTTLNLSEEQARLIAAIYNPTVPVQMAIVKKVVADAGAALDATTEALLKSLLNPAGVQKQIENASKPGRVRIADLLD
jgi:hypothetical protein